MKMYKFFFQGIKSSLVAMFIAWPAIGWSATVTDRPLFIDAAVDHNLMFVVDDSGSMDYEVLAPEVGEVDTIDGGYIFDPGEESGSYNNGTRQYKTGKKLIDNNFYSFSRRNYYLRSGEYNLQYYDPAADYSPWPSTSTRNFGDAQVTSARLDPGLSNTLRYNLTNANTLGLGSGNIPATFFVVNTEGTVDVNWTEEAYGACPNGYQSYGETQCRRCTSSFFGNCYGWTYVDRPVNTVEHDEVLQCSSTPSKNWYENWLDEPEGFVFKDSSGTTLASGQMGFAPDGKCLERVELKAGNESRVAALTGETLAEQQQNFANWFEYYRRRHQAIRGAIGESVRTLENMRLGVFWINSRRDMAGEMFDSDTALSSFLNGHYSRFDNGSWKGGGTPNRLGLNHAGKEFAKESVRGTLECRNNFALQFTDGYANSHNENSIPANNADGNAPAPFGDNAHGDTLGDIAYYYYQGLRDSSGGTLTSGAMRLDAACGTSDEKPWMDCNGKHHMNSYTVGLGMKGENFAGISHFNVMDAHKNPPNWGDSSIAGKDNSAQIDDLYHAAVNGKGEYYDAKSTVELVASLQSAVDKMKQQLGSGSNVSFNTTSLKSGGYIYSAQFTSQIWAGTLRAEAIDKDGNVTSRKWDAATQLDARDLETSPRLILTNNGSGVSFAWNNLTAAQKNDLKAGGSDTLGQARLSYVKGNEVTSAEGVTFRDRESRLGAIVNSAPVYVGEPNHIWPDKSMFGAQPYSSFKTSMKSRDKAVYVGANDGMLHGFDADTGEEILGYIPAFLYSTDANKGLSALTNPNLDYQSYVDLPLNTSDVYVNGAWRSVVIGGSRGAEPGIFALDVTDPSKFSVANAGSTVMWEFSGNSDLGHLTEAVQIALLKWGDGDYRWSAVFSNGYGAPSGKNGLFILDIANPANYEFIELGSGGGLSPVRLADFMDSSGDLNSDGVADRAYAGDLEGRLWAIDLSGGKSNWDVAFNGSPLFTARDNLGNVQPITAQPGIARNTFKKDLEDPNLLVFFGTGKYLDVSDIPAAGAISSVQSFYGISDRGTAVDATNNGLARDDLVQRVVTTGTVTVEGQSVPVRKTDGAALDWANHFGWYLDLPSSGERVVEQPTVSGDYVVFASTIPLGGDPCGGGGSSFVTALQLDGSTDSSKSIIDVNNDGKLDGDDQGWAGFFYGDGIVIGLALIDNLLGLPDTKGDKPTVLVDFGANASGVRRLGWQEIID